MKRFRIKFSFLLFNALLFLLCDGGMILSFYAVCVLHELGHIAALRLTGRELRCVELSFFGIRITSAPAADIKRGAAVLLSGPAVNLLLYAFLRAADCCGRTAVLSLAAGLFNLLPLSSLDGGALLDMLAEGRIHERQFRVCLGVLRALTALALLMYIITEMLANVPR